MKKVKRDTILKQGAKKISLTVKKVERSAEFGAKTVGMLSVTGAEC